MRFELFQDKPSNQTAVVRVPRSSCRALGPSRELLSRGLIGLCLSGSGHYYVKANDMYICSLAAAREISLASGFLLVTPLVGR